MYGSIDKKIIFSGLATPGDYYGTNVNIPVSDAQAAQQLGTTGVLAQKFTSKEDFEFISLGDAYGTTPRPPL